MLSDPCELNQIETAFGKLFNEKDLALLQYSAKLTQSPAQINAGDVTRLRTVGFDDRAIHDIACIVGYYAFVNRIADGLGVEVE